MSAIKKRGGLALLLFATLMWQACNPPGPSALLRGERLIKDGKYQSAIKALQEATTLLPNNAQAWNHLGLAYHWQRQYNQAVQAYRKALDLNYELAPARFNLGSLLLEINQPKLAVNEFDTYTLLRKEEPEGWFRRGMAEWRARQWDEAYESFQKSLTLNPAQPVVWNSIGVIELYRKNPSGADQAFREALKHQPDYAPAIYNTAIVSHFHLPRHASDPRPYALERYRQYLALPRPPLFTDAIRGFADHLDRELNPHKATPTPPAITNRPTTNVVSVPPIAPPAPTNNVAILPVATNEVVMTIPSSRPEDAPKTNVAPAVTTNINLARIEPTRPKEPEVSQTKTTPSKTNVIVTPAGGLTDPATPPVKIATAALPPPPLKTVTVTTPTAPPVVANHVPTAIKPVASGPGLAAAAAENLNRVLSPHPAPNSSPGPSMMDEIAPNYTGLRYTYLNPTAPTPGLRHRARPYFDEGRRLQRLTQWNDAIAAYRKAIGLDGAYFEAYHNLALAAGERDFLRAAIAYETALALRPNSGSTRFNFAALLNKKQYHLDAAAELVKLVQQEPDNVGAHLLLATIFDKHLQQRALARKHYSRVIEIKPAHRESTAIRYWLRAN